MQRFLHNFLYTNRQNLIFRNVLQKDKLVAELLAALQTPGYIARQTLIKPKYILKAKKAIKKAFTYQVENQCFSFVELVSICPTNWGMTPVEAVKWAEENMLAYYTLGEFKTPEQHQAESEKHQALSN